MCKKYISDYIYFIFQIAFIDNTTKLEDLAKKFGFQKEDVICLQPGRSV